MALSKEIFSQLLALQEQDAALDKLKSEMDKIPVEIAVLRERLEGERARLGEAKARALALEKRKKEKELELAQKEEAVKKHSLELNQVKTNEAFKALQREIEQAKAEGSQIETEILEIMEELDVCRKGEKALQAELGGVEKAVGAEISALEFKLAELRTQFEAAQGARDQAAAALPADVMRVYSHIRSRGKPNAVVAIDGDNCSACRVTQSPNVIVEATKAKALVICESCQRILYRPEALAAKTA